MISINLNYILRLLFVLKFVTSHNSFLGVAIYRNVNRLTTDRQLAKVQREAEHGQENVDTRSSQINVFIDPVSFTLISVRYIQYIVSVQYIQCMCNICRVLE